MSAKKTYMVGIDIGSMYLKVVRIDDAGNVSKQIYSSHKGEQESSIREALDEIDIDSASKLGITGILPEELLGTLGKYFVDLTRCQIKAVRMRLPDIRNIIDIGGGSAALLQIDYNGNVNGYRANSMCAAGTGSFLDEQANRLQLNYKDIGYCGDVENPPTIASRCCVFAKSDLIHRQQQGYSKVEMWSGLCKGIARTVIETLLSGKPLKGPTTVIGGVACNTEVMRWLKAICPNLLNEIDNPHLAAAIGAALLGNTIQHTVTIPVNPFNEKKSIKYYDWSLLLEKSKYPLFNSEETCTDEYGTELRILRWPSNNCLNGFFGIDIGSTSTKLVFMNSDREIVFDAYRKTSGEPIAATRLLFLAINRLFQRKNALVEVQGVGVTGSGRRIIGNIIGADLIINEISAHVSGTMQVDPTVDTIFEIGGQDSKYMHVVNGHIKDAQMNYVCAAGTGSFVEEQANKLGFNVSEIGNMVLGINPPIVSDRCTVFMGQDIRQIVQTGANSKQALAAITISVVKNYLNKVVGNRYYNPKKIFFQGATARNIALVAAFEKILGVEVVVSPYCHVMGAYGAAISAQEKGIIASTFRGFDLDEQHVKIRSESCVKCQNECTITFAEIKGIKESPSWGYACGRDPHKAHASAETEDFGRLIKIRNRLWSADYQIKKVPDDAPVIGIPCASIMHMYLPLWKKFFNSLGLNIILSGPTTDEIKENGSKLSGAEFCFPMKVMLGHVASLLKKKVDYIFVPQMYCESPNKYTTNTMFCPYIQGTPYFIRSAFALNGFDQSKIISPLVDMKLNENALVKQLSEELSTPLKRTIISIRYAWRDAISVQRTFQKLCQQEGQKAIERARQKGEKIFLLVGRTYNIYDKGVNLNLPQKISGMGMTLMPMDFLSLDYNLLSPQYQNTYWIDGQKILTALEMASREELFHVGYLTNFGCGPDSFLLSYADEIMGSKPFLSLELDSHNADTGFMTRIEAFFDVIKKQNHTINRTRLQFKSEPNLSRDRTIWIPPLDIYLPQLTVAVLNKHGYKAKLLGHEDQEAYDRGRLCTRGTECLPTCLTIGNLLKALEKNGSKGDHTFFLATGHGPCRFGQYCTLHRNILNRKGYEDVAILSPSSHNSYQGINAKIRQEMFESILIRDILMKLRCKIRPYCRDRKEIDQKIAFELNRICTSIRNGVDVTKLLQTIVHDFSRMPYERKQKPIVGIVGEIYVRNNAFSNENLIDTIEEFGGEVWVVPLAEWFLYISSFRNMRQQHSRFFSIETWKTAATHTMQKYLEHKFYFAARPFIDDRREPNINKVMNNGARYMKMNVGGEAILSIGRTIEFAHQNVAMVVNCAPFGCMPGNITAALFQQISDEFRIPIVNMVYDGRGGQNKILRVYLNNLLNNNAR